MRPVFRIVRLLFLLPAVLIIGWSIVYLRACLITTLAPGAPFRIEIRTPGGSLTVAADSFTLSPSHRFASLNRLRVLGPDQRLILSARSLTITGYSLLSLGNSVYHVRLNGVYGVLVRNKQGQLVVSRYFPASSSAPSTTPFQVDVTNATLQMIDEQASPPWTGIASSKQVTVSGIGPDWRARGSVFLDGGGQISASVSHNNFGETVVHGRTNQFLADKIWPPTFASLPPSFQQQTGKEPFRSAAVTAVFSAKIDPKGGLSFSATGSAAAHSLALQGNRLSQASFRGSVTDHGLAGVASGFANRDWITASGNANWQNGLQGGAYFTAQLPNVASLPPALAKLLPAGAQGTNIAVNGPVFYHGGKLKLGLTVNATDLSYQGYTLSNPMGTASMVGDTIALHLVQGSYLGTSLRGTAQLNLKSKAVSGAVRATSPHIENFLAKFAPQVQQKAGFLSGNSTLYAIAQGTLSKPEVLFRIRGNGTFRPLPKFHFKNKNLPITNALAVGRFANDHLWVQSLSLQTPGGELLASGLYGLNGGSLSGEIDARAPDVGAFTDSARGSVALRGTLSGTLSKPVLMGQADAYQAEAAGYSIPLSSATFTLTPRLIDFNKLEALVGSSHLEGTLAMSLPGQTLSGELDAPAVELSDLFGDKYVGQLNIKVTHIQGKVTDPSAQFSILSPGGVIQSLPFGVAFIDGSLSHEVIHIDHGEAGFSGGSVGVKGEYNLHDQAGTAQITVQNVLAQDILPDVTEDRSTNIEGVLNGTSDVAIANQKISHLIASGTAHQAVVNGTPFGEGIWSLTGANHTFDGNIQFAYGDRFLSFENGEYDSDAKTLKGELIASNLQINDLYKTGLPYLSHLSQAAQENLSATNGTIQLDAILGGKLTDPTVDVPVARIDQITYRGQEFGSLDAKLSRNTHKTWTVDELNYKDGSTESQNSGTITENGPIHIDGEIDNVSLSKISQVVPGLPTIHGQASLSFVASGTTAKPLLHASLETSQLSASQVVLGLSLDTIVADSTGIQATGNVSYKGLEASIDANVPFDPSTPKLNASLTFAQQALTDVAPFVPALDQADSNATLQGKVTLSGSLNDPLLNGAMQVDAPRLAFQYSGGGKPQPLKTEIRNLHLAMQVNPQSAVLNLQAQSSLGGSIEGSWTAPVTEFLHDLGSPQTAAWDHLTQTPINAQVNFKSLAFSESLPVAQFSGVLSGPIQVTGAVLHPLISGKLALNSFKSTVPAISASGTGTNTPTFNPKFDLSLTIPDSAHVGNSLFAMNFNGAGHLTGNLRAPQFNSRLLVLKGNLNLPGGRVFIEKGSTISPTYAGGENGAGAKVSVDLQGVTHVMAAQTSEVPQRYDVSLQIFGDLLDAQHLTFVATSDPPDLSQSQILALLGRQDLIDAFNQGNSKAQQQFGTALAGYAVSSFLNPITSDLANSLKFDYLSLDYDRFGQTSISVGKSLGKGLVLSFRRQLSQPAPGLPTTYDLRLTYRLPFANPLFRRVSFMFGIDQDHPWKFGIDYTIRY